MAFDIVNRSLLDFPKGPMEKILPEKTENSWTIALFVGSMTYYSIGAVTLLTGTVLGISAIKHKHGDGANLLILIGSIATAAFLGTAIGITLGSIAIKNCSCAVA